ncbi:3-carboxy-cis,cis-muconate cycloisomerase [Methylobacterium platani]|uniref:3-carboxy-cis,cis-muconate cycloisomerase n=2 Tax=Methylobacterium platani TaxID=427683 RepID=A0A179S3I7_9HYPH|nr:3-carboxy-cis,cis-muconate cycloisomerase [Methylobacterium platani]KMO13934.1 3-carboxy-cis,cis-muconate cycloisomerase [Methylobacterium platani JCM 14648]OAS20052.1 3-carboxy-cis,cis-muconate cycloisomerase [Methylobacterium platani]
MAATVIDSLLFRDAFGTPAMREVFSDQSLIRRYIEAEIALARAEAACGVIPAEAAEAIARDCSFEALDLDLLRRETDIVGYPILPLVHQLVRQCGEAGRYVHWGATTQDIMDTASVLQIRAGLEIVEADLAALRTILADLSARYRDTPMAGRTHLQQALPVTFGYKTSIWLAMIDRHAVRLEELKPRVLVGQFAGAAGTLASLGAEGLHVQEAFCLELGLGAPASTWHVARDGFAEVVNLLALVTGTLGKIALDIMLMASTEFAEVAEPFVTGRGASSTMPQKRNPISSELMLAAAKGVRQQAGLMLDAMVQDFERATGPWHAEWMAIPESFVLTAGALHQAKFALGGLIVDEARMRENLGISRGLIVAEAVMMALAPRTGRQQAHDLVYAACRVVDERGGTLAEALMAVPEVTAHLDRAAIDRLTDPANYLGSAPEMVDRVLSGAARGR